MFKLLTHTWCVYIHIYIYTNRVHNNIHISIVSQISKTPTSLCVCLPWHIWNITIEQGKSEGFDSCARPSNSIKIGFKSSIYLHVTLKFDGWPKKTIHHVKFCALQIVGKFKLGLQSGNVKVGCKLAIFCHVWPSNLIDDQHNRAPLEWCFKLCA